jgi:hypothetical protein
MMRHDPIDPGAPPAIERPATPAGRERQEPVERAPVRRRASGRCAVCGRELGARSPAVPAARSCPTCEAELDRLND